MDKPGSAGEGGEKPAPHETEQTTQRREFIETFFRRGAEFAEELMRDNERLRYRMVQLEEKLRILTAPDEASSERKVLRELVSRIEALEGERQTLLSRFEGVARSSADVQTRFLDIERENNNLVNLYVASYQLHSTVDLREVTQIILEILLNFVGAKTFAVQLVDEEGRRLRTLAAEGVARESAPTLPIDADPVARVLKTGQTFVDEPRLGLRGDLAHPAVVVPLMIASRVVGVLVIWDLLQQKTGLQDVDFELFNLLGGQAGAALQAAKLTAELGGRSPQLWGAADLV